MKKNQFFLLVAFTSILIAGCGGKNEKGNGKQNSNDSVAADKGSTDNSSGSGKLDGAWEIKRAEGDMASLNTGTVYTFKGNKLTFGKDGFDNPGTTEVTDSTFCFQADGTDIKFMYNYKMNGDTMVVTMQNGTGGQVFHMVKQ